MIFRTLWIASKKREPALRWNFFPRPGGNTGQNSPEKKMLTAGSHCWLFGSFVTTDVTIQASWMHSCLSLPSLMFHASTQHGVGCRVCTGEKRVDKKHSSKTFSHWSCRWISLWEGTIFLLKSNASYFVWHLKESFPELLIDFLCCTADKALPCEILRMFFRDMLKLCSTRCSIVPELNLVGGWCLLSFIQESSFRLRLIIRKLVNIMILFFLCCVDASHICMCL